MKIINTYKKYKNMKWFQNMARMILFTVFIGVVLISCGCIENSQLNTISVQTLTPTTLSPTTVSPIQNQTTTNSVTVVYTVAVTPSFTDTTPVGLDNSSIYNRIDSSRSYKISIGNIRIQPNTTPGIEPSDIIMINITANNTGTVPVAIRFSGGVIDYSSLSSCGDLFLGPMNKRPYTRFYLNPGESFTQTENCTLFASDHGIDLSSDTVFRGVLTAIYSTEAVDSSVQWILDPNNGTAKLPPPFHPPSYMRVR
jgi:hypothetical protein